jgi:hypothetical protein
MNHDSLVAVMSAGASEELSTSRVEQSEGASRIGLASADLLGGRVHEGNESCHEPRGREVTTDGVIAATLLDEVYEPTVVVG